MKTPSFGLLAATAAVIAVPAFAHHSFAMFDTQKTLIVDGTVKEFQWTNPHAWLNLVVPNDKGGTDEWAFELGSPSTMIRTGWKPNTLKPGDKVSVTTHPMKSGVNAGQFVSVKLPDGTVKGGGGNGGGPGAPTD